MLSTTMFKLTLSFIFGLLIGLDRQLKQKPLGVKTTVIICVASCLITIVSIESAYTFEKTKHINMDPLRLAAQIVSGIGFLGAGVILRRNNDVILGLTSAAIIWASAGIGIAVGAGFYGSALYSAALFIVTSNFLAYFIKKIGPQKLRRRDFSLKIVVEPNYKMTELLHLIKSKGKSIDKQKEDVLQIKYIKITDLENGNQQIDLKVSAHETEYTTEIYYLVKKIDHVLTVQVERL
ncbi:MgtC/SapB family protein [Anoxybacillus ayderensis]|uniref:MgtC/SapB family protein n=1 Tax=Anoxybacillus ayderensis TaxID=265546 RepID=UPI000A269778|nr:MgtC/SapB family protein [Anoxybacillus ayderensis]MED0657554.1 MgtC/SapB family protein [Anoxybacillus ayderensis]OSX54720.1 methyltransferase [Anoxybacillus ayderensis]